MNAKIRVGLIAGIILGIIYGVILVSVLVAVGGLERYLSATMPPVVIATAGSALVITIIVTLIVYNVILSAITGAVFGLAYRHIPTKSLLSKAYIFNTAVYLAFLAAASPFMAERDILLLYGSLTVYWAGIIFEMLTSPLLFAFLFSRFEMMLPCKEHADETSAHLVIAPRLRRIAAFAADMLVFYAIALGVGALFGLAFWYEELAQSEFVDSVFLVFGTVMSIVYFTLLEGTSGATLGKKLMKIKVVKVDGGKIGYRNAALRNLTKFTLEAVGRILLLIDSAAMLVTSKKQRAFDKLAHTVVVLEEDHKLGITRSITAVLLTAIYVGILIFL